MLPFAGLEQMGLEEGRGVFAARERASARAALREFSCDTFFVREDFSLDSDCCDGGLSKSGCFPSTHPPVGGDHMNWF